MKNYKEYLDYCQRLAEDVNDSYSDDIDVDDRIFELADGNEYVIYTGKAWELVNMIRECNSELFDDAVETVQDNDYCGIYDGDIHKHMILIAFTLIRNGIHSAYQQIESEVVA